MLLILLFNAIMFLLVEVPLIGYLISPEGTTARVKRFQTWLGEHARIVAAAVAVAICVYLVLKGILGLNWRAGRRGNGQHQVRYPLRGDVRYRTGVDGFAEGPEAKFAAAERRNCP